MRLIDKLVTNRRRSWGIEPFALFEVELDTDEERFVTLTRNGRKIVLNLDATIGVLTRLRAARDVVKGGAK